MYRRLVASAMFAGILPLSALAQGNQEGTGNCFSRNAACVENCGPIEDAADDNCIANCLRVDACELESHRSSRSNLSDSDLPKSSMPDSSLPGDKFPQSRLP